mmetsp:Transcript_27718/g.57459  ORF Transcript_27718/g.57459 Transcript_27718/m.57459 type:complete len:119 (-) Transcript_27718:386-742(-)
MRFINAVFSHQRRQRGSDEEEDAVAVAGGGEDENEDEDKTFGISSSTTTTKTVPHRNKSRPALKSKTNMVRSQKKNGSSEVYNRLYSKGTASYNSKRKTVVSTQSQSKTHGEKNVQMK